jgi:hypothetical protein
VSVDIAKDDRLLIDGELVTVVAATSTPAGYECIVKGADAPMDVKQLTAAFRVGM